MISISEILAKALNPAPSPAALEAICGVAVISDAPMHHRLFATGDKCENFVLVAQGRARVQISTRTGREMILFRLNAGESCALTTSCLLTNSSYYAEGIAETDLKIISIPAASFRSLLNQYPDLSVSLLDNYARRIGELTSVIDRLVSRDLSFELKSLLREKADAENIIKMSHQKIADELGSSREVISRKLKAFENAGLVKLARGRVQILSLSGQDYD